MNDIKKEWDNTVYPDMIRNLPEADIPVEGVRGWLMQTSNQQVVLFDIDQTAHVPPHSHCAQWGLMVAGEMSLTIGGETKVYKKGDSYFIPEGVEHSAKFHSQVFVIDWFDAPDRYQAK
jgi:quercetin dioxygenase-like cupin family protein